MTGTSLGLGGIILTCHGTAPFCISGLSFVAGLIGLAFTVSQIHNTNLTLQATNAYAIQKDARELALSLQGNEAFRDYVMQYNAQKKYTPDTIADAHRNVGRLLNFYLSVYRQYKAGGISTSLEKSFAKDFCDTLRNPIVGEYWQTSLANNPEHAELKDAWCKQEFGRCPRHCIWSGGFAVGSSPCGRAWEYSFPFRAGSFAGR
jgi:hypothetical protein